MKLTINSVNFNTYNFGFKTKQIKDQKVQTQVGLVDLDASLALRNQILFKGSSSLQRERLIAETIEKNSLPIKPETLSFVLSPLEKENDLYVKYLKTGSKFFDLFLRYFLHTEYPFKDEGELTDIIADFIKFKNKARIIKDFIPKELLPSQESEEMTLNEQSDCLNAFLGAIIYENEDGYKTAFEFLKERIGEKVYPDNYDIEEGPFEKLARAVKNKGYSWHDLYQKTRYSGGQWLYAVYFKDMLLVEVRSDKYDKKDKEQFINQTVEKIESGEINLADANDDLDNLPYVNYKKPTSERLDELEAFCQKWNLEFNDINLLHKVFLYGEMQDGTALAHCDTYEALEYVGDAVLGFCIHEILQDNLSSKVSRQKICAKRHAFVKNENLITLSKEMKLPSYTINRNTPQGDKRKADMFEALIGAIFMDGKEVGINKVYRFLDKNFRDKICSVES